MIDSNCDDGQSDRPIDSLGARLVAYDEGGVERIKFAANTDIAFVLCLNNQADYAIDAGSYFDFCDVFQKDDFLLIYKLVQEESGEEHWIPYGKPYQQPAPCPTIATKVIVPAHRETKVQGRAWNSVPNNPPFTAGKYYTAFSYTLELNGHSRKYDLKLEFEVY